MVGLEGTSVRTCKLYGHIEDHLNQKIQSLVQLVSLLCVRYKTLTNKTVKPPFWNNLKNDTIYG